LFDSIPQDAFLAADGQLFEILVTLSTPEKQSDLSDPEILSRLMIDYDEKLVNGNYYSDRDWNRILLDYKRRLHDSPFLFPTATLNCIRNLHRLSKGNMLLLSGDRGYSSDAALLDGRGAPVMAVHGSISMMVDYQIIGEYCRNLGAEVLHPSHCAESLNISAFIFGDSAGGFNETRAAYDEVIEKFGPDDFFTLKQGFREIYNALTLGQILAFLRLSCWDYRRFWECLPALKKHLPAMTGVQKQQLREAIVKVWDSFLPIGEESDLAFDLGTLLVEMDFHEEALEFLQSSVDLHGIAPGTAYNIAVCYYSLGRMDQALDYLNQALSLDNEFAEAKILRAELVSTVRFASKSERGLDTVSTTPR
jgi:tetratricopeptide (TPR) repeat protein